MITNDQIRTVVDVDEWAQENRPALDKKFSRLYEQAANTDEGWKSVAESSPHIFYQALGLALEHKQALEL